MFHTSLSNPQDVIGRPAQSRQLDFLPAVAPYGLTAIL
jgi:hypothetical protein